LFFTKSIASKYSFLYYKTTIVLQGYTLKYYFKYLIVNIVPLFSIDSTVIIPPFFSIIVFAKLSPIPILSFEEFSVL